MPSEIQFKHATVKLGKCVYATESVDRQAGFDSLETWCAKNGVDTKEVNLDHIEDAGDTIWKLTADRRYVLMWSCGNEEEAYEVEEVLSRLELPAEEAVPNDDYVDLATPSRVPANLYEMSAKGREQACKYGASRVSLHVPGQGDWRCPTGDAMNLNEYTDAVGRFNEEVARCEPQELTELEPSTLLVQIGRELKDMAEELTKHLVDPHTAADRRFLRTHLILEEVGELIEGMGECDELKTLDGLADALYVIFGSGSTMRMPLGAACEEVHTSNMTKERQPDDPLAVRVRSKGPGYRAPALGAVFYAHRGRNPRRAGSTAPVPTALEADRDAPTPTV